MYLYITEQGARLSKKLDHLIVSKGDEVIDEVLFKDVEAAILFGSIHPTTDAMMALVENGAEVAFLSQGGHFKARLVASTGKNSPLRMKQYDCFCDPVKAKNLAREYVHRKLENGFKVLEAYSYNTNNPFHFDERESYLNNLESVKAWDGDEPDTLRGLEGLGARYYFQGFARCLMHGIEFPGRKYYPSTDPVNALLSFGYSFVARELESLIESYGLDPHIGFYHTPSYGRASLSLDLVEEFRHPLVDRLVLRLFNREIITAKDFERQSGSDKPEQLYLKRDAVRLFVRHYEEFCDSSNRIYKDFKEISWRRILRLRVEALRRALLDDQEVEPFTWEVEEE
jgi:CRISPR-associated protein Cas1